MEKIRNIEKCETEIKYEEKQMEARPDMRDLASKFDKMDRADARMDIQHKSRDELAQSNIEMKKRYLKKE